MATLALLRLLDGLPPAAHATASCIAFAAPPVGNAALAAAAQANGWQDRIRNYTLPEDWVPGLLSWFSPPGPAASSTDTAAAAPSAGGKAAGSPSAAPAHERVCCGYAGAAADPGPGGRQQAGSAGGAAAAA